ncbi:MAG: hypothetical protein H0T43_04765 [Solirubrobacterales bacterium]|nr:hypothetical protein [Solirubrobacterales bacterium]
MSAAAIVTIAAIALVVLVIAIYLITLARVLSDLSTKLVTVIGAVAEIAEKTEPVGPAVSSISGDLEAAREALDDLLVSKLGRDGAAALLASVDPLAEGADRAPGARPALDSEE